MANQHQNSNDRETKRPLGLDASMLDVLGSVGEQMTRVVFAGKKLTAKDLLTAAIVVGGTRGVYDSAERDLLQGALGGASTNILNALEKRLKGKNGTYRSIQDVMTEDQFREWIQPMLESGYAKAIETNEKNPTLLMVPGMLTLTRRRKFFSFLNSRELLDPKTLTNVAVGSAEEAKMIKETKSKIVDKFDKINANFIALNGALDGDDETSFMLLRKLITIPEETGPMALVKKLTGIDLEHIKPEKLADNLGKEFVAKTHASNVRAQSSLDLYHRVNLEERLHREQAQAAERGFWSKVLSWLF